MMDDEYLSDEQKEQIKAQQIEMNELGLTSKDLNISLNVSNNWKLILYKYFLSLNDDRIREINSKITAIYDQEEGKRVDGLTYVFSGLKAAFQDVQINVFPQEPYEISPFDRNGDFTWGRLYRIYVSGSPKKIISSNIAFISSKFSKITAGRMYTNKLQVEQLFEANNLKWVLKYYNKDLTLNMNAFYAETIKIVSNIIQYKIPFYLTFYVSIFKLFLTKQKDNSLSAFEFDINKLINIFEEGETAEEYSKLIDYGLPITTVAKISDNNISMEELKSHNFDENLFDSYERLIITETLNLI